MRPLTKANNQIALPRVISTIPRKLQAEVPTTAGPQRKGTASECDQGKMTHDDSACGLCHRNRRVWTDLTGSRNEDQAALQNADTSLKRRTNQDG
jgi:hypothetical protein